MDQVENGTDWLSKMDWVGIGQSVLTFLGQSTLSKILGIVGGLLFLYISWRIGKWVHGFKVWKAKEETDQANKEQDENLTPINDDANKQAQQAQDNVDDWARKEREKAQQENKP